MINIIRIAFVICCTLLLFMVFTIDIQAKPKHHGKHASPRVSVYIGSHGHHRYQYRHRYFYHGRYPYYYHYYPYSQTYGYGRYWQRSSYGHVPHGSVIGGYRHGYPYYHCRAQYRSKVYLGRLYGSGCHINHHGRLMVVPKYRVLTR